MAKQPNYREIATLIRERKPFVHQHSMRANLVGNEYLIFSYQTLIATLNTVTGEKWLNDRKYSVTTSKQQTIVKANL
jgi:hypothetical protein